MTGTTLGSDMKNGLKICHWNIQSLYPKMEEVKLYLISPGKEVDILCFTETWLNDSHENSSLMPKGYNIVRRDRDNGAKHGGILLFVNQIFPYKRRSDIEAISFCVECIWLQTFLVNKSSVLFYRPLCLYQYGSPISKQ